MRWQLVHLYALSQHPTEKADYRIADLPEIVGITGDSSFGSAAQTQKDLRPLLLPLIL